MAWNGVKLWAVGETLTAADMIAYINDNLDALKDPPSDNYEANEGADYTTASTTFVDVDATGFSLAITTTGGDVMVGFVGSISNSAGVNLMMLNVDVDGGPVAADDGIVVISSTGANYRMNASFTYLVTGLAAAAHTFKLQWKTTAGTATMLAGAGTANGDIHPQFWAREVS